MSRKKVNADAAREQVIAIMTKRVESDPDEIYYFEALIAVVESVDLKDRDTTRSALLSRVAVSCPWLLERIARRAA